jgi:hypothetical protein
MYYREKLENEANIVVAEPTSDWQIIDRNVTDDFYQNFGALRNFNDVSIIIEQASVTATPPNTNFDDISLYELVSYNESTPIPTPTTTPTIEVTPTEPATTTDEDKTIVPETSLPETRESKIQIPTLSLPLILIAIIVCIAAIAIAKMRGRKKSGNVYCINCGKEISKKASICPHCKSNQDSS